MTEQSDWKTSLGKRGYKEEFSPFGDPDAHDPDPSVRKRFFGKYRGTVAGNVDPLGQGRLLVLVPDVLGLFLSSWALPCLPFAGDAMGSYVVPMPGAALWVEFEQGDPEHPIWVGGFWDVPQTIPLLAHASQAAAPALPVITIETPTSGISVCDVPLAFPPSAGNVNIHAGETVISLTPAGVQITAPSVTILAPTITMTGTVTINGVTTINGDTSIVGAAEITGDATITGATSITGLTTITGAAAANGGATIQGGAAVNGGLAVQGALLVDGVPIP